MITIIHGDDTYKSREYLNQLLDDYRSKSFEISYSENNTLSLFGQNQVLVLENYFSQKTKPSLPTDAILWQDSQLTSSQLKTFPQAKIHEFKLPAAIFSLLDNLNLSDLPSALSQDPPEKIFAMIGNRLHLLLIAQSDPENLPAQGFYRTKILSQAKKNPSEKLSLHAQKYLKLEYAQKSGQTSADWTTSLALFLTDD